MMTERQHAVSGPLACYANGFRQGLASLGDDKRRASKHLCLLVDLSGWLEDEGLPPAELIGPEVTQFLEVRRARGHRDLVTLRGLALLLDHLRRIGVVPAASRSIPDGASYGYRPGRSALHALATTRKRCWRQAWVVDLDIRAFFDSVPHD